MFVHSTRTFCRDVGVFCFYCDDRDVCVFCFYCDDGDVHGILVEVEVEVEMVPVGISQEGPEKGPEKGLEALFVLSGHLV